MTVDEILKALEDSLHNRGGKALDPEMWAEWLELHAEMLRELCSSSDS